MGKRGPQKTPTEDLARRGSWRAKEPERQAEVKLPKPPAAPDAPKWLSKDAAKHWAHVTRIVFDHGLMRAPDVVTVGLLCEAIATYIRFRDEAAGIDGTYATEQGYKGHPIHRMQRDAMADMIRLIREMGMSPAARVGLIIEKPEHKMGAIVPMKKGAYAT